MKTADVEFHMRDGVTFEKVMSIFGDICDSCQSCVIQARPNSYHKRESVHWKNLFTFEFLLYPL